MEDPDRSDSRVRPCGVGFSVEVADLYVWESDAEEAARGAAELLGLRATTGAPPVGG